MTVPSQAGLRALFTGGSATGLTDGQLLERFQHRHESAEAAFEALVDRHAAMVWGVCRRSLDRADAEDAFQATFLVLVRRAGAIRPDDRGSVGRWLYGVARRVAGRLRQEAAKRPPAPFDPVLAEDPASLAERRDVREAVAAELDRLPSKYRRPIELCDFEGLTYEQAGVFLGWPTATLKNRLAQGRSRLRDRLMRRGLAPAAAAATAAIARECQAGVPKALVHSTCRAGAIASGTIPAAVARLAEGVTQAMLWNKLKLVSALLLSAVGATLVAVAGPSSLEEPSKVVPPSISQSAAGATIPQPRVEILGVTIVPAGPGTWWKPDGTPLKAPPFDRDCSVEIDTRSLRSDAGAGERCMIVYRVYGNPQDVRVLRELIKQGRVAGEGVITKEGRSVPGLKVLVADFDPKPETATIPFSIRLGDWRTIQTLGVGPTSVQDWSQGPILSSGIGLDLEGRTQLTVAFHTKGHIQETRVVAVDEAGAEQPERWSQSPDILLSPVWMRTMTFGYPREKIREFRLQVRPGSHLINPTIALHPRKADEPR